MSLRRLALLAVILAAVGAYYYVVEHRGARARVEREAEAKRLFHFAVDDAAAIAIQGPDPEIRLERRDAAWHVVAPVDERADEVTVGGILDALAELTPARALEPPDGFAEYGLEPPAVTVTVRDGAGAALATLSVGDLNPDHSHRFVRAEADTSVGLVPVATYDRIVKSLFDVRSKQWTRLLAADVDTVALRGPDGLDVRLSRETDDGWLLAGDPAKPAAGDTLRSLLNGVLNARVVEFIDAPAAEGDPYGLAEPEYTAVFSAQGTETRIRFGTTVPESTPLKRYAAVGADGRVLVFNDSVLSAWPKERDDLRERKLLAFSRDAVTKIALHDGADTVTITRDAEGEDAWTLEGTPPRPADPVEVGALLGQLERLEAARFLHVGEEPVTPADFAAAPVRVQLWLTDVPEPLSVRFAPGAATEAWYALRAGDAEVYPVEDYRVTGLPLGPDDLVDKHLARFDRAAVHQVSIELGDRTLRYTRKSDETWRAGPGAPRLEAEQLDQLLWDLRDLKYQALVEADEPALAGPPTLVVQVRAAAGDALATLRIGGTVTSDDGATLYAVEADGTTALMDGRFVTQWAGAFTPDA